MSNAHYFDITTSPRRMKQPSALTALTTTIVEHAGVVSAEKSEDDTNNFPKKMAGLIKR